MVERATAPTDCGSSLHDGVIILLRCIKPTDSGDLCEMGLHGTLTVAHSLSASNS